MHVIRLFHIQIFLCNWLITLLEVMIDCSYQKKQARDNSEQYSAIPIYFPSIVGFFGSFSQKNCVTLSLHFRPIFKMPSAHQLPLQWSVYEI